MKFKLACPSCGKERDILTKGGYENALKKQTSCASCRTVNNNKKRKGTKIGNKNPAWAGYGNVPGKVLSKLRRDASTREIFFNITIEDIDLQYVRQNKLCALTGIPVFFGENASVDRINSQGDYEISNIQIVHKLVNIMKRDIPEDDFISLCVSVAKNKGKI